MHAPAAQSRDSRQVVPGVPPPVRRGRPPSAPTPALRRRHPRPCPCRPCFPSCGGASGVAMRRRACDPPGRCRRARQPRPPRACCVPRRGGAGGPSRAQGPPTGTMHAPWMRDAHIQQCICRIEGDLQLALGQRGPQPARHLARGRVVCKLDAARLSLSILSLTGTAAFNMRAHMQSVSTCVCGPARHRHGRLRGAKEAGRCEGVRLSPGNLEDMAGPGWSDQIGDFGKAPKSRCSLSSGSERQCGCLSDREGGPEQAGKRWMARLCEQDYFVPCWLSGFTPTAAAASCASAVSLASAGTPPMRVATPAPPVSSS